MSTLNELSVKHSTDKGSLNHFYCDVYELLFSRFTRHLYIHLLEVGVQFGCSMRMWREYFPYATLTGIDCADNHAEGAHKMIYGDAYSKEVVDKLEPNTYHIIIDDGSHEVPHQVFFIENYLKLLTDDGLMIVEDVPDASNTIPKLVAKVPQGYNHCVIDLRTREHNTKDSILFLVWR